MLCSSVQWILRIRHAAIRLDFYLLLFPFISMILLIVVRNETMVMLKQRITQHISVDSKNVNDRVSVIKRGTTCMPIITGI